MADSTSDATSAQLVARLDRIANLLALAHVRDLEKPEKIRVLDAVGYTAAEIGALLDEKPNTISSALYRQRKPKKPPRRQRTPKQ